MASNRHNNRGEYSRYSNQRARSGRADSSRSTRRSSRVDASQRSRRVANDRSLSSGTTRARSNQNARRSGGGGQGGGSNNDMMSVALSRYSFLGLAGALGAAVITARLAEMQIFNADKYRSEADARRLNSQILYAKRGTIYDRNGNVLVSSAECKNVYINPSKIEKEDLNRVVNTLVDVLGVDKKTVRKLASSDTTFAYIKRQVDLEDIEILEDKELPGVEFEPSIKRVYPYDNLASQVLGIVNVDNVGMTGLEKQYDEVLTGENGSLIRERGNDGGFIAGGAYKKVPAQDGMDIVLALDINIQRAAEEAIAEAVEKVSAKYGSVIVTDPTTGEILAACSYPTYKQNDLEHASNADLNLRVVTDVYEPGSTFKPLVVAAGLEAGLIEPSTTLTVPPVVKAGDDDVRDVDLRDFTVTMDIREILRRSSNTGMVLVGEKLGADVFSEHVIGDFAFGTSTGIDFPGESLGIIKKRSDYDGASVASMSFGQSLAVEPVQMVRAMSAIANKGIMTTPHFLKARAGEEVDWTDGEQRAISEQTAATVADFMLTVVDEGTGELAQVPGYEVSGKTGTAERAGDGSKGYQKGNNMASFIGFVSTHDPRVMCYVTLDGTTAQSYAATPVFKQVMETALPALGIKPTR